MPSLRWLTLALAVPVPDAPAQVERPPLDDVEIRKMSETSRTTTVLLTLFGLNRAGQILYKTLFVLAVPALVAYTVWFPRLRFSEEDERLFRAARHGDRAAVERALAAGAGVNAASPIDGKTALFRAAVFGQADTVRLLLDRGADPAARGLDGRTALEVVSTARSEVKDPSATRGLDAVAAVLRGSGGTR